MPITIRYNNINTQIQKKVCIIYEYVVCLRLLYSWSPTNIDASYIHITATFCHMIVLNSPLAMRTTQVATSFSSALLTRFLRLRLLKFKAKKSIGVIGKSLITQSSSSWSREFRRYKDSQSLAVINPKTTSWLTLFEPTSLIRSCRRQKSQFSTSEPLQLLYQFINIITIIIF